MSHESGDKERAAGRGAWLAGAFDRLFHNRERTGSEPQTIELGMARDAVNVPLERQLVIGVATDVGCVRTVNEDAVVVVRDAPDRTHHGVLAVVCDGMGGHAAGEIASGLAIEAISRHWTDIENPAEALPRAIQHANRAILSGATTDRSLAGMGTTVIAVVLRDGLAWCAHVGDSRCYLVRDGELFLMTEDHSAVMDLVKRGALSANEARGHPDKNVISRALGARRELDVTTWPRPFRLRMGDQFLLCSDGLYDLVSDETIRQVLNSFGPQAACDRLVALAREGGAPDNVTVAVLSLAGANPSPPRAVAASDVRDTRVSAIPVSENAT